MSIKNSNDTTGNRTRGFPFCSAVPRRLLGLKETFLNRTYHAAQGISEEGDLWKLSFCTPCSGLNLSLDNFASLGKQIEEAEITKKILFLEDKNKI
jgi:hypothetical protein